MIDIEMQDEVAVLHLRHGKAQALDVELCEALAACFAAQADGASRAVVLTGHGTIFSAGVDLPRVVDGGRAYVDGFMPALIRAFEAVAFHPTPVVAAINGHAIAGGCVLACAADHRVMASGPGRIGVPELQVGVPFPTVALELVRHVATATALRSLLYGGATHEPEAARQLGLVDDVVEPARLLPHAVAHARRLAALPSAAFALTKQQLLAPLAQRLRDEGAVRRDGLVQGLWGAAETQAAIRDHVARTLHRRGAAPTTSPADS